MFKRWIMYLILILALIMTLGCGLGGTTDGEEATPPTPTEKAAGEATEANETPEAPATPTEAAPAGGEEMDEEETISLSSITEGLQGLDSYRGHLIASFHGTTEEETQSWTLEIEIEQVREPFAQHLIISGTGMGMTDAGQADHIESIQIGDQQYLILGEECISSSVSEGEGMDTEFFKPDDLLEGLENAHRVRPDETVNGILCRHYQFDEKSLLTSEIQSAKGDMWVAVDGDYVVKYVLEAEGKDPTSGDEGQISWTYEIRDVNAPITIEPPASCGSTAESEFPIMSDAVNLTTMGGMLSYESESTFDDVLAFYQTEMEAAGWEDTGESFISEDMAMLTYVQGERKATVTLSTSEEGKVSVFIMNEE